MKLTDAQRENKIILHLKKILFEMKNIHIIIN